MKTRQSQYTKRKLHTTISHACRCKNPWENIGKPNPIMYKRSVHHAQVCRTWSTSENLRVPPHQSKGEKSYDYIWSIKSIWQNSVPTHDWNLSANFLSLIKNTYSDPKTSIVCNSEKLDAFPLRSDLLLPFLSSYWTS